MSFYAQHNENRNELTYAVDSSDEDAAGATALTATEAVDKETESIAQKQ